MFYRLIVNCDDYGRFDARPAILKARLFPLKEKVAVKEITDALRKLISIGCVVLYEHDKKPFLYLPSWETHQIIRAKRSKYPTPAANMQSSACNCIQMIADDIDGFRNPIQSESKDESESKDGQTPPLIMQKEKRVNIDFIPDERLQDVFAEFIEHRSLMRKPINQLAAHKLYQELLQLAETTDDQIRILNTSIASGWKGIFPLKQQDSPKNCKRTYLEAGPQAKEINESTSFAQDPEWLIGGNGNDK